MTVLFAGLIVFDGWLDGSLTASAADSNVQGTIFCILIGLLVIPALLEFARLAAARKIRIFLPVALPACIVLATYWYWQQFVDISPQVQLFLFSAFLLFALLLSQYLYYGTSGTLANCGANYFCIIYLGLLSSFCLGIRIDFGLWWLFLYVFTVKCADIGAYTVGSLLGKHKFVPRISPNKTWEGMAGAVAGAMIAAICLGVSCDIMDWPVAAVFGLCFAFVGQGGDLAESMIKRDAEQKDSVSGDSVGIPGYGGVLDVIDSPLFAAPFAYVFFMFCSR